MLKIGTSTRLLSCFSILVVVIFSAVHCALTDSDASFESLVREERDTESVKKLLDPKGDFLAGEDTPVWLAYKTDPENWAFTYQKLEKGIVKKAIDYWKSDEFTGITRKARSVDDNDNIAENDSTESIAREIINDSQSNTGNRVRRQLPHPTVLHPSILVLMSYETDWPSDKKAQEKLIYERILYALAFWNGVDLQLRAIDNPRVRLRIAGIVIGRNKEVTHGLYNYQTSWNLNYEDTLAPNLRYWGEIVHKDFPKDFPKEAYNVVATMTDSWAQWQKSASTERPPCSFDDAAGIGGLIFQDDLAFDGLQRAVLRTAYVLGQPSSGVICSQKGTYARRTWDECDLSFINLYLSSNGQCLGPPKEFHRPGKPVEAILPGKLMPASKQCQARGWTDGNVCWDYVTCDYLYCSNDSWASTCRNSGAPVDGTTCAKGMICLNAECVSNTTLTYE